MSKLKFVLTSVLLFLMVLFTGLHVASMTGNIFVVFGACYLMFTLMGSLTVFSRRSAYLGAGITPGSMNIAGATNGQDVQLADGILNVFSQEILFKAQPNLRFEAVAVIRTELGQMPGNTIKFIRYNSLTGDPALSETQPIVTDSMSTSTIEIIVGEYSKAISVSQYLLQSSLTDVLGDAATLLGMHYQKHRDGLVRDTLLGNVNVLYGQEQNSRAALTAASTFNIDLVRAVVETLATNKAPKFQLDAYVAYVHPHQARYIRQDPAWVNVNLYGSPENIINGEIGRIEDVRFIETTQVAYIPMGTQNIWADSEDTGLNTTLPANNATNVYRAIVVGDYAVGLAEALPVEMRDNGVEDFGRKHSLAYYGIWGAGLIEEGHSVICETA